MLIKIIPLVDHCSLNSLGFTYFKYADEILLRKPESLDLGQVPLQETVCRIYCSPNEATSRRRASPASIGKTWSASMQSESCHTSLSYSAHMRTTVSRVNFQWWDCRADKLFYPAVAACTFESKDFVSLCNRPYKYRGAQLCTFSNYSFESFAFSLIHQ